VLLFAVPPAAFRGAFEHPSPPPHTVAVIPARYHSTRFPGKPLADVAGHPMIEHVYRRTAAAPGIDLVIVATDDERIARVVEGFGGEARMTRTDHRTGLDRVAEVAGQLTCEIVVNVQGDEPLIEPMMIAEVVRPLLRDPALPMSTLRRRIEDPRDIADPNVVKVVVGVDDQALYFSRASIPHVRGATAPIFKHIGIYAYRRAAVGELAARPQTPLEMAESLEQLRALEHGFRICAPETRYDSIGVDSPEDLERVRRHVAAGSHA
jgi:3-deoxy-manno-octulosonate cytidylyltransferase (CMP-KDO synthetase)